jgi:hypothetical protein
MPSYAFIGTIKRWQGPDGEHMGITDDVPEGSTYHAVDTGKQYIFHDGGWVEDLRLIYALTHV